MQEFAGLRIRNTVPRTLPKVSIVNAQRTARSTAHTAMVGSHEKKKKKKKKTYLVRLG